MKHLGDITKISGHAAPIVDCIIGGSPCQDLSIAGKREGLDGERSGLFIEQIRIVKEMREEDERRGNTGVDVQPRYMLWENVPGAFSSHKGQDFRIVLEETAKIADENAAIPMPESGKWTTSGCIVGDGWSIAWRVLDAQFWGTSDKPLPQRRRRIALVADFGGESAPEILFVRQSVSGDTQPGESKGKETAGDAARGTGADDREGERTGEEGSLGGRGLPERGRTAGGDRGRQLDDVIGFPWQAGPSVGLSVSEGLSPTLIVNQTPAIAYSFDSLASNSMKSANPLTATDYADPSIVAYLTSTSANYTVRRLTPLECERLQGFPDGWTDIGEWTDTSGRKRQTSDAVRYKALGNSIALPQWKWVLKRLCACYERDATMASLFDGIGGFPFLWEQLNGKGSCLWASEIEEFPIAVTKVRIGE